jgi:NADPH:quinone reductase-like Zn-dependent oxidoreductase
MDAGATHVVATDEQDLVKEVLGLTGGKGARVVFDPVGGPTMEKLVGATMPHGIILVYGALSPELTTVPALELVAKSIVLRGFWLAEITLDPTQLERLERGKRFVNEGLADGRLKPIMFSTEFSSGSRGEIFGRPHSGEKSWTLWDTPLSSRAPSSSATKRPGP